MKESLSYILTIMHSISSRGIPMTQKDNMQFIDELSREIFSKVSEMENPVPYIFIAMSNGKNEDEEARSVSLSSNIDDKDALKYVLKEGATRINSI